MPMKTNHILTTAIEIAVDLFEDTSPQEPIKFCATNLGLDWIIVAGANGNGHVAIQSWDGDDVRSQSISEVECRNMRDWAAGEKIFYGKSDRAPFPVRFVSAVAGDSMLLVPEYRTFNIWGAIGFGGQQRWTKDETEAMAGLGRLLLSVVRHQDAEDIIRKQVRESAGKIRQTFALVPA